MWKCMNCGGEILKKRILVEENRIDKNCYSTDSVNEYQYKDDSFICDECGDEKLYIQNIAEWVE